MHGLTEIRRMNNRPAAPRPDFQKRHFHMIAAAIKATRQLPHDSAQEAITDLIENLCDRFKHDNAEFRPETFRAACGDDMNGHRFTEANR